MDNKEYYALTLFHSIHYNQGKLSEINFTQY